MNTNHLSRKVTSVALATLLIASLVPAQAITPIDLSPAKAYAATPDAVPDCRTNKVVSTYLTKQSDGTYALNRSALKTREQWKDLGLVGFLLYQGYTQAADVLINPMNWYKPSMNGLDPEDCIVATDLGDQMDATAFANLHDAAKLVVDANYCRAEENSNPVVATTTLSMLKTSPELMALCALQTNCSAVHSNSGNQGRHCNGFSVLNNWCIAGVKLSENDITKTNNPHGLWHYKEKNYQINSQTSKDRSHYLTLVDKQWTLAGGSKSLSNYIGTDRATYVENFSKINTYNGHTLTAVDANTYLDQVDAYIAFVESQPSTPGSGLDGSTDTGSTTTKPATKPQPKLTFGTSYTEGRDPNGSTAATYVLIEETGSPITLDIVLTLEGKTLTEGTDYTVEYLSNVKPGTASYNVYPAKSGQWDPIRGDFIILAKPETAQYSFYSPKSKVWDESLGGYRYFDNEAYTRLIYDKPSAVNSAKAKQGWHTVNGKSYYVYDQFGNLICWDATIEGTAYKAQFDSASKTYYLVKDTTTKPSTGGSTTTKPTEPEKPSTGTTTTPETPSKPSNPDNPSTTPITPSKPNPGQTTPEKPSVTPSTPSNPTPSKPAPAVKNGWVTTNGNTYYYVKGTPLKGWQTLSGKRYYFNSNGVMAKWTQKIGGATYYFNGQGVMQTGWTTVGGKSLYFGADGKEATAKQVKKDNAAKSTAQKAVKKAKVTAKKAKGGKKSLTVMWKKLSKANQGNVTGFEVQYSTKSSFKGAKTKRVSGKAKTSAKLTKLKSGTKYYVRVRSYKNVKLSTGKTVRVYGSWSKKLSAKTTAEVKLKAPSFKVTDVPAGFKVTITKKSAGASGYQIRYCGGTIGNTYPGYEYKKVGKSTKTTGRIFGQSDGNVVWVRAYKKVGKSTVYSAWSKPKQAWPLSL